ncbi:MAG: selenocysteine-specific translation elongation factor [Dehalococcoidia bacterium]|nr:selenocysteine-specific translation elongation factor [Dehalococcoidia bacterium]
MFVIGTAGHVDHGKSSLIHALTGINPDRLREERERGLTIELGFAWLTLPSGREVSIVDVPGHVRFVRHMLAGIGAVDLALLVVAADEGIMPQTREHLEILDLLEVTHGIVALTKCDLVEGDWVDLMEDEVRDALAATSLASAPVVRVSSATGAGLDELRAALDAALESAPEPSDIGRPRLGIDRVFTMPGFGTVVTGTLLDGRLRSGDTLEATPEGPSARIRGLQTHRHSVEEALPGTRVAVNLAGVAIEDLRRGQVLAPPGRMAAARSLDARVRVLSHRPLRHNLRVALHLGTAEVQARVRVMGRASEVPAGEEGWCQLVLTEPLAAVPGDLFVLRVSDETVAGGRVVEVNAPRHRRTDPSVSERMAQRAAGTPESRLLAALERMEPCVATSIVAEVELEAAEVTETLQSLVGQGAVHRLDAETGDPLYVSAAGLERTRAAALRALDAYHHEHPLRFAMPREELRSRLRLPPREFAALLHALAPGIASSGDGVAEAGWQPAPPPAQQRAIDAATEALRAAGMQSPRLDVDAEVIAHLEGAGVALDLGDGVMVEVAAFQQARRAVVERLPDGASMTLAEARDLLGTNRRVAQAFLETLDRQGVTRRQGEGRVLGREGQRLAETPD